eukprot:GHVU01019940.1.p1 GENE.GHVU01019940.1~~GHVU01019940.1.p1  ORF type:complete len:154 (+),score=18.18 GHVU01019940.1:53-514(+)
MQHIYKIAVSLFAVVCYLLAVSADDCKAFQKTCPDGSCVNNYEKCKGECSVYESLCDDGSCVPLWAGCGDKGGQPLAETCKKSRFFKLCDDGTCVHRFSTCPGECPDGEVKCPDNGCVADYEDCDNDDDSDSEENESTEKRKRFMWGFKTRTD